MHIQGHSSAGGRHGAGQYRAERFSPERSGAGRQQDRVRDTAEEQQGRHIVPINAHPEVQAELRTVTGFERANGFAPRHRFAV